MGGRPSRITALREADQYMVVLVQLQGTVCCCSQLAWPIIVQDGMTGSQVREVASLSLR